MKSDPRIAWISSYLPRSCGIAYYSADYINALKNFTNTVVTVISHTDAVEAAYPVIQVDERLRINDRAWHTKVQDVIKEIKPDVVHIQHEYGLYECEGDKNARVVTLLKNLKEDGIPTVITYHSVYSKLTPDQVNFVGETLKIASAGVVHCQYQKDALPANLGWEPQNVYVIPHGSREDVRLDRNRCKKRFGYEGKKVVGLAGLAEKRKAFERVIKLWPELVNKFSNPWLAIEVKPHFSKESIDYISELSVLVASSPAKNTMDLIIKDYSTHEFYTKLRSFDILALPYLSESQSGVLAHALAAGTPAVVSDVEGLGFEIKRSEAGIAVGNDQELGEALIKLMNDDSLRAEMQKNAQQYVKDYSGWSKVAEKTLNIYSAIMK